MSKKRNRVLHVRCCKCNKPLGVTLLITARASERTINEIFLVTTYLLCEDCKKSSISTITDPVTGLNFEVQCLNLRHNSEQKSVKREKTYEGL